MYLNIPTDMLKLNACIPNVHGVPLCNFLQVLNMKTGLLLVLLCLAVAPCSIEGGPVVKEKGNSEVVDW